MEHHDIQPSKWSEESDDADLLPPLITLPYILHYLVQWYPLPNISPHSPPMFTDPYPLELVEWEENDEYSILSRAADCWKMDIS